MDTSGRSATQIGVGLCNHVKQFCKHRRRKVEAPFDKVLMHVFDDLVALEVMSGHQAVKMAHGAVKNACVPCALLLPAPVVKASPQCFFDDHPHLDDLGLLKKAAEGISIGMQTTPDENFGDEQGAAKVPRNHVSDVFQDRRIPSTGLFTRVLKSINDVFPAHRRHPYVLNAAADGINEA